MCRSTIDTVEPVSSYIFSSFPSTSKSTQITFRPGLLTLYIFKLHIHRSHCIQQCGLGRFAVVFLVFLWAYLVVSSDRLLQCVTHLSTVIAFLALESAIVRCVWVSSSSAPIISVSRGARRWGKYWSCFAVVRYLVNPRLFWVKLNSEASWMAVSITKAISKALVYFSLSSESKRFCICTFRRPQTNLSRKASLRFAPNSQWVASFFRSAT